jgi:hypothetical protein
MSAMKEQPTIEQKQFLERHHRFVNGMMRSEASEAIGRLLERFRRGKERDRGHEQGL